jgi:2-oxo-4-hydroxy-4-carboxy-5-ureidoimidazoline decarboxylase
MMTLETFNQLSTESLEEQLTHCCGSSTWVREMMKHVPFQTKEELFHAADTIWHSTRATDWREAFLHHPKIGDIESLQKNFAATAKWAEGEQGAVKQASQRIIEKLAEGNRLYEQKFGFIFIVCATGKSAKEMLALLQARLPNNMEEELKTAMLEQQKITQIRLNKLLA